MKRIALLLILLLLPISAAGTPSRSVYVLICANAAEGLLKTETGLALYPLTFDHMGQVAAGPLPPGTYQVEAGSLRAVFTLRANGAVTQVTGDGWTDGEAVHLSRRTTGTLTVRCQGSWQWQLEGEGADRAVPDLFQTDGGMVCVFSQLPLGFYVLRGPGADIPVLLTEAMPEQTLQLPVENEEEERRS